MRFIATSNGLLRSLQQINGVISTNAVLSVLENFLFELNGNTLSVTATDLETMMRIQIPVNEAEGKGRICIPSKILLDYLKNLPDQPVTFTIGEDERDIEISSSSGKYKIGGEKADEFPKEPEPVDASTLTVPASTLIGGINKTLFAVSNDTLRPAMTGVYFELENDSLGMVATDAHRLIRFLRTGVKCPEKNGFIVPKKPLQQLKSSLPADDTELSISYNANHLFISTPDLEMSCRLIDAKFPDYRAVIPSDNPYLLTINKSDFLSALRRVSVFANKTTSQVLFDIVGNSLQLSAQDIDFSYEGKENLPCNYRGEDMKIAFNARLMIEMIQNLDGEEVEIELSSPTIAGIFRPSVKKEDEELFMLLMPLMVGV